MSEIATQTVTSIAAEVAAALKEAASEYGPQAMDMALLAYQVEAIRMLILPGLGIVISLFFFGLAKWFWGRFDAWKEDCAEGLSVMGVLASGIFGVVILIASLIDVSKPAVWIAAFGSPELLIATNALKAAGLM